MSLKLKCPACGKTARLPEPIVEQTLTCDACGSKLHVAARTETEDSPSQTPAAIEVPGDGTFDHWFAGKGWLTAVVAVGAMLSVLAALWIADLRRNAGHVRIADRRGLVAAVSKPAPIRSPQTKPATTTEPNGLIGKSAASTYVAANATKISTKAVAPSPPRSVNSAPPDVSIAREYAPHSTTKPLTYDATTRPGPALVGPPEVLNSGRPALHPAPDNAANPTDKQIGDAIQAGVDWMVSNFNPTQHELKLQLGDRSPLHGGMDALCVYALMQSNEAISDPRLNIHGDFMKGCIETMKHFPNEERYSTYARGIRATALALYDRQEDRTALANDVKWLIEASKDGAYTYTKIHSGYMARSSGSVPPGQGAQIPWDNSNSQYGLLGVWSGAESEIPVPLSYWQAVEKHWVSCQATNGQWAYGQGRPASGTISMSCAGVASLFVTHDWLDTPRFGASVGRVPFSPALKKGLEWFEQGNNSVNINGGWRGYTIYGVERVGLASGFKFFGEHDWYRELAIEILRAQGADGSWNDGDPVETAYSLLFLSRGRHPILMNKLRFDGFWANSSRDVSNLARYTSHQLERTVNWQVVPLSHPWTDWNDSPIVYLASHERVKMSESEIENLRAFVLAGGMLFTQADGDSPEFNHFAVDLAHRLFPEYEMTDLPANSPIYSVVYKINPRPPLQVVSNGARVLMVHSPTDLARAWQLREQKLHKAPFELGVNLFIYAAGKRDLRNRLDSSYVAEVNTPALQTVDVARVKYAGNWDPEPYAWTRFARVFQRKTGYAVAATPVPMRELNVEQTPLAHLTGTGRYEPTSEEVVAVRKYVESGGVLVVDLCGGTGPFDESARTRLFAQAFPDALPRVMGINHPLLVAGPLGMQDISHPRLRPYTIELLGNGGGYPSSFAAGKGHVIFTSFDLTSGLLGTNTWGILGYEPAYAEAFMRNLIFWTIDGQKEE